MAITVTVRRDDSVTNPVQKLTAAHIELTGLDPWTADPDDGAPFDVDQDVYYVAATVSGDAHSYQSPRFTPSHDGKWEWDGFIFPSSGAWTLTVWRVGTGALGVDESVKTQAVTVAA